MHLIELLLLAVGLSADTIAVSATRGAKLHPLRPTDVAIVATLFGFFHFAMPALGYVAGVRLVAYISRWDHWLAFGVLGLVGGKTVVEGLLNNDEEPGLVLRERIMAPRILVPLALATSIDAVGVGLTLPVLHVNWLVAATVIGLVAWVGSTVGAIVGHKLGASFGKKIDVVGGLVLIAIGVRILTTHLQAEH